VIRGLDQHRNAIWAGLIAFTVVVFFVFSSRARASRAPDPDPEEVETAAAAGGPLTPVPMSVEMTGAPTKPPLSFVSAFTSTTPRTQLSSDEETAIVTRARLEIDRVTVYDASWMQTTSYPMGDVPSSRGACTDVVVRSLREIGVDLQELVHEDIVRDMHAYGVTFVDNDIDHRRVGTMFTFFQRNAVSLPLAIRKKATWRPGDIVFVNFSTQQRGALPEHAGIISDKIGPRGYPLVIENGGPKPVEQDSLGHGKIVGHFRALKKPGV
jgi:uncharacterized protein YijF (DUF1287 family)